MFKSWVSGLTCFVLFLFRSMIRVCIFVEYHELAYEHEHALMHRCCSAVR